MTLQHDKNNLIRVFIKGGMVTPQDLTTILEASAALGNEFILFGSRQDILFPARNGNVAGIADRLAAQRIDFRQGARHQFQNLVSSAVASGIMDTTDWLDFAHYRSILEAFEQPPHLKINVTDARQAMVPLFTGDLNFVASTQPQYWHLYLRNRYTGDQLERWPTLVHSTDIAKLSVFLEQRLLRDRTATLPDLIGGLAEQIQLRTIVSKNTLRVPDPYFPYYEGMESMGTGRSWLGLYWRNNRFNIPFLLRACQLCAAGDIPYFYITPWKSFVIKGIHDDDRLEWEKLMGGMGINMRHSSLELNWHIPVLDEEALKLKQFLVGELDQQDICTHGLTFGIITEDSPRWFTSIVIKRKGVHGNHPKESFDLYYAEGFDPNSLRYFEYAKDVATEVIPALLVELSKSYYVQRHR